MQNIIQIGACVGKDKVMEILCKNKLADTIVHLIEPFPNNFEVLQANYSQCVNLDIIKFYNCAISSTTGRLDLHYQKILKNNPDKADEHCSFSYDHLIKHGHEGNIANFSTESFTLNDFINKYSITGPISHLYIDTEGHDCDIILAINFTILNIQNITFETVHSDGPFTRGEKLEKTLEYLESNGFYLNSYTTFDITVSKGKNNV